MTPELARDSAAASHQGSLQPSRAFNPSEKGTAQDGQENSVNQHKRNRIIWGKGDKKGVIE